MKNKIHWELVNHHDVWGNAKDGYEVNDQSMFNCDVPLCEEPTERQILVALKEIGYLNKHCRLNMLQIEYNYPDILINYRNGKPMGTLQCFKEINDHE